MGQPVSKQVNQFQYGSTIYKTGQPVSIWVNRIQNRSTILNHRLLKIHVHVTPLWDIFWKIEFVEELEDIIWIWVNQVNQYQNRSISFNMGQPVSKQVIQFQYGSTSINQNKSSSFNTGQPVSIKTGLLVSIWVNHIQNKSSSFSKLVYLFWTG